MTLPNGVSAAYNYDAAGRLTGMKYNKGGTVLRDLTYSYDEINRRTAYAGNTAPAPRDTATDTATVNALNQYTTRNGKPVAHDNNANQTINNAVWDARDRLVSLSGPNFTASFTYDAMGRRTSKTVNGQTKTYLYDGSDLISETGADYTFGPGIDQPLERKSGQNEYYLSDALGSVIGLADGTGTIKTSYNYSPFGKKQTTGTASSNPFAFTGREDDGTGYYYYRARYYSPEQKRFIAEDPLGFGGGDSNLQAYVGNSPTNFTDPLGLFGEVTGQTRSITVRQGGRYGGRNDTFVNPNVRDPYVAGTGAMERLNAQYGPSGTILQDTTTAQIRYTANAPSQSQLRSRPPGFINGDDRGHIVPRELGGANLNLDNFFAQNRPINQSNYRDFAGRVRDYLDNHQTLTLTYIVNLYYERGSLRPIGFEVEAIFCDGRRFNSGAYRNP
jgi:RHS repeat-associated protein